LKYSIIIATLIGLALGIVVPRNSAPPAISPDESAPPVSTRSRSGPIPEISPELSWDIRGNLTSSEIRSLPLGARRSFLSNQVSNWERNDSEGLRTWLSQIDDPALHKAADDALAVFDNQLAAIPQAAEAETPSSLVKSLYRGDYNSLSKISKWDETQARQAIEAYQNLAPEEQAATYGILNRTTRRQQGSRLFQAAVYQHQVGQPLPEDSSKRNQIMQDVTIFAATWAGQEPAKAAAWAADLPTGPAREWSLKNVARAWQGYSDSEAQTWINTLPTSDQAAVETFLQRKESKQRSIYEKR
jgi:hypothetical protein